MSKASPVTIPSLTENARRLAERLATLGNETERRRRGVSDALLRLAGTIGEVAAAANQAGRAGAYLLSDQDLRRLKEQRGRNEAVALVVGRGHTVAGLLKFESTPDGYIEATIKTWRQRSSPVERRLTRHEPDDDDGHRRSIQRFLDAVDRAMGPSAA